MAEAARSRVSIPAAGTHTIRGLTDPGSYQVSAFVDTENTGVHYANAPIGTSDIFTDTAPTGINFELALPSPAIGLQALQEVNVIYGDTTATIFYDGASDNDGNPIATSYNLYWSTADNPGPGNMCTDCSVTGLPSGSHDLFVKFGLTSPASQFKFAVTAVLDGSESAPVNANTAPSTSGVAVSGTVTTNLGTSGITMPVNPSRLLLLLINDGAGAYISTSVANPTSSQAFSFSGVPVGTYMLYTILDLNNNGFIDTGDISDTENGVLVTVGGTDVSGVAVALAAADAYPYVQTRHYSGDNYGLGLGTVSMLKRPVNVAVSGPQIPTRDMGLSNNNGSGSFETWQNVALRPTLLPSPDSYTFTIEYSSGSGSSPLTAPITGIVDSFATPTTPVGTISYPAPDPLQFSWTAADPTPGYSYNYSFWLNNPNDYFNNDPYWNMSSATTSIN
ncbi:MAG: hypothetical protein IPQ16_12110 [Geobacteraceae bacterium]|nr:hypothetical protein [Geobacteraceae bacterium]